MHLLGLPALEEDDFDVRIHSLRSPGSSLDTPYAYWCKTRFHLGGCTRTRSALEDGLSRRHDLIHGVKPAGLEWVLHRNIVATDVGIE